MVVNDGICHQKGKFEEISNITESSQQTTDEGQCKLGFKLIIENKHLKCYRPN